MQTQQPLRRNTRVVVNQDVTFDALFPWNRVTVHAGAAGVVLHEKPLMGGHTEVLIFDTGEVFKFQPRHLSAVAPAVTRQRVSLW